MEFSHTISRAKRGTFTHFIKGKALNLYTLYSLTLAELSQIFITGKGGTFTDFIKGKAWKFYTLYLGQSVELVHTLSWAKR